MDHRGGRGASQLAGSAPASSPGLSWRGCDQGKGTALRCFLNSLRGWLQKRLSVYGFIICYISGNPKPGYFLVHCLLCIMVRTGEASPLGGSRLVCSVKEHGNAHGWSGTGRETLCPQAERGQQRPRPAGHWRAVIKQRDVLGQQVGDVSYTVQNIRQHHIDPAPYQTRSQRLLSGSFSSLEQPREAKCQPGWCLIGTNMASYAAGDTGRSPNSWLG